MFEARELSKLIREKKKHHLRQDMDYAGQEALDPNAAWDAKQDAEVNTILDNPNHEPATEEEMGENDSSQDKRSLKRAMSVINKYFHTMLVK